MADKCSVKEITIDGTKYVRADSVSAPVIPGKRAVVVVDRGWIFAGDISDSPDGGKRLTRAVHVFSWQSGGFTAVVNDPKAAGADLRKMSNPVDVPNDSIIFTVPVNDSWGL